MSDSSLSTPTNASPLMDVRPSPATLFSLPAAAAEARSKYLAQGFLLFVGLVFLVGTFLLIRWSSFTLDQRTLFWESRLSQGAAAAARRASIEFDAKAAPWARLAQSDGIKLYTMEAISATGERRQAARDYLENAFALTLEREGISVRDGRPSRLPITPRSGLRAPIRAGLALVGTTGEALLSLGGAAPVALSAPRSTPNGATMSMFGPYLGQDGKTGWFSLVVPIEAVQGDELVAELHITYPLEALQLFSPEAGLAGGFNVETALALPNADLLLMLSDTGMQLQSAPGFYGDARYRWAAAHGRGTASAADQAGDMMLVAAKQVPETRWIAVQSVDRGAALASIRQQTVVWLLTGIVALGLSCGLILYSWRRAVAHRAAVLTASREAAGERLTAANDLLNTVASAQPSAVLLVDGDASIGFANDASAQLAGQASADAILGKTLHDVYSMETAALLVRACQSAHATAREITASIAIDVDGQTRHGRITARPLDQFEDGHHVLLAFDDVTEIVALRARREAALRHLVSVLTGLIDARDPFSARQSRLVAAISRQVARAMDMTVDQERDIEMAALLSNAGKILVPRGLLTKPDPFTPDELETVRAAMQRTGDLLEDVDFDGRVHSILSAMHEAEGGEQSDRQQANIIAGVNALVGMVSPRAHRDALSLDSALDTLAETVSDQQVLAAIIHVVRNHNALQRHTV
ncbi:MAG: HD domain-containing phosphohydrolase [Pseudomonadota bacterium]